MICLCTCRRSFLVCFPGYCLFFLNYHRQSKHAHLQNAVYFLLILFQEFLLSLSRRHYQSVTIKILRQIFLLNILHLDSQSHFFHDKGISSSIVFSTNGLTFFIRKYSHLFSLFFHSEALTFFCTMRIGMLKTFFLLKSGGNPFVSKAAQTVVLGMGGNAEKEM